ncbi:Uncharacterised protein [Legionella steigerwaltii]|uniref:Uncharacterized protein n=1 Tax=Legionella steigerwaltii TaxID=460 RepID=A0A378LCW2_9GAMM|nr:hypothetical protein Lstg_0767 [Legionella steigerwaltii]STY24564.1 Uncharacterised protein [Legionella steigerwaltii]
MSPFQINLNIDSNANVFFKINKFCFHVVYVAHLGSLFRTSFNFWKKLRQRAKHARVPYAKFLDSVGEALKVFVINR